MKSSKRTGIKKGAGLGKKIDAQALLDLMRSQQTVRNFKTTPVSEKKLNTILQAARWAPSAANTQPWDFIVVKDPKTKEKIADIIMRSKRLASEKDKNFPYGNVEGVIKRFTDPPILIVVCGDTRFVKAYPKFGFKEQNIDVSMGAAIQNMMLIAKALGLSLSWGTLDSLNRDKIGALLHVPTHIKVMEVLQLGYPVKMGFPGHRRDPQEFVHLGSFDASKLRSDEEIEKLISTRRAGDIYSGTKAT